MSSMQSVMADGRGNFSATGIMRVKGGVRGLEKGKSYHIKNIYISGRRVCAFGVASPIVPLYECALKSSNVDGRR